MIVELIIKINLKRDITNNYWRNQTSSPGWHGSEFLTTWWSLTPDVYNNCSQPTRYQCSPLLPTMSHRIILRDSVLTADLECTATSEGQVRTDVHGFFSCWQSTNKTVRMYCSRWARSGLSANHRLLSVRLNARHRLGSLFKAKSLWIDWLMPGTFHILL